MSEPALEPDLPIVDAHHHCWEEPPVPQFYSYGVEQLWADKTASGHNIIATVYMEANSHYRTDGPETLRPVGETAFIDALADESLRKGGRYAGTCAGIVAHADLMRGAAVLEVLEVHRAASPGRLKGIRHRTSFDPDNPLHSNDGPQMLARPAFREGLRQLAPLGLSFDALVLHPQIPELTEVAREFPDLTIVLNHIGAPMAVGRFAGRPDEVFTQWSALMAELATCPNVVVKVGGMNMDFTGLSFIGRETPPTSEEVAAKQRGYVLRVIELFGPERCMFESNFPVDKLGIEYGVVWNAFKRMVSDFSRDEKTRLFSGTAARTYRLRVD